MVNHPITIAGIVIPTDDPTFLAVSAIHTPTGILCVVAGARAMVNRKTRGTHTKAGLLYCSSAAVVFAAMSALKAMRWADDYQLFVIGFLSFAAALAGRRSIRRAGPWTVRGHIVGMGTSYVLLLVAFYVDNGWNLPLWKQLPAIAYWGCRSCSACRSSSEP